MTHIVHNPERMKDKNKGTALWMRPEKDYNLEDMHKYGLELIKNHIEQKGKQQRATYTITFERNLDQLDQRHHTDESFRALVSSNPVFSELDEENFLKELIKVKPSCIILLISIFRDRYTETSYFEKERGIIGLMINQLRGFVTTLKVRTIKLSVIKDFHSLLIELQQRSLIYVSEK